MDTNIKYTTDGKKVVVLGKINAQESIVQEIFIINGQEVPSGENFVVRSLHDAPAKSWKEKDLADREAYYQRKKEELARLLEQNEKKQKEVRVAMEYAGKVIKTVSPDSFSLLVDYITGNIKWIVTGGMGAAEIVSYSDFNSMHDNKIRLVSLWGNDDGTLNYYQGYYSDASGYQSKFWPFADYQDALDKLRMIIQEQKLTDHSVKMAQKYGFTLADDKMAEYKNSKIKSAQTSVDNHTKSLAEQQKNLEYWTNFTI
jgi:hypothetical protein